MYACDFVSIYVCMYVLVYMYVCVSIYVLVCMSMYHLTGLPKLGSAQPLIIVPHPLLNFYLLTNPLLNHLFLSEWV